jgi:hypothetical protein
MYCGLKKLSKTQLSYLQTRSSQTMFKHYSIFILRYCICKVIGANQQRWASKFFALVRKSQIRKFLGSFRHLKSATFYKILHNSVSKQS